MASSIQTLTGLSAFSTASMTSSMASSRLGRRPLFHWNSRSSSIMRTGSPGQTVGWRRTDRKRAVSEYDGIKDRKLIVLITRELGQILICSQSRGLGREGRSPELCS